MSTGAQDISIGTSGVVHQHGHQERHEPLRRPWRSRPTRASRRSGTTSTTTLKGAGFRPKRTRSDYITNTNGQAGGPLMKNKLFYFGSVNYPADARERARLPGRVAVHVPVLLGDTSQQDTTDIPPAPGKLTYSAERQQPVRGLLSSSSGTTSRIAARATANTQDSDVQGVRHRSTSRRSSWNSVVTDRCSRTRS